MSAGSSKRETFFPRAALQRWVVGRRVAFEEPGHLIPPDVAGRIVTVVAVARQLRHPVGRNQGERIPTLAERAFGQPPAFDDVLPAELD